MYKNQRQTMSTKTITVNPELFRMTKKKRPSSSSSPAIRPRSTVDKNKTVRRNQVLKFIRGEQEKLQRKLLDGDANLRAAASEEEPAADFQDSLDYLMNLAQEETGKQQKQHGWSSSSSQTLKHRPMLPSAFQMTTPMMDENVSLVMPDDLLMQPMNLVRPPMPKWGCLKGGQLPSYRQYTQRNRPTITGGSSSQQQQPAAARLPYTTGVYHPQSVAATLGSHSGGNVVSEMPTADNFYTNMLDGGAGAAARHSEIRQTMAAAERAKPRALQRQQRTVRRTYNVGKNKSQVSVLVSNKTIRNRVTAKTHEIRQKPLEEVKRFLINKGFVRVGTSAPNDVLRKMYESAQLICGEIQNHNPENLLFNFMAGSK